MFFERFVLFGRYLAMYLPFVVCGAVLAITHIRWRRDFDARPKITGGPIPPRRDAPPLTIHIIRGYGNGRKLRSMRVRR